MRNEEWGIRNKEWGSLLCSESLRNEVEKTFCFREEWGIMLNYIPLLRISRIAPPYNPRRSRFAFVSPFKKGIRNEEWGIMRYYIPLLRISLIAPQRTPLDEVDLHSSHYPLLTTHYLLMEEWGMRGKEWGMHIKLHYLLSDTCYLIPATWYPFINTKKAAQFLSTIVLLFCITHEWITCT